MNNKLKTFTFFFKFLYTVTMEDIKKTLKSVQRFLYSALLVPDVERFVVNIAKKYITNFFLYFYIQKTFLFNRPYNIS